MTGQISQIHGLVHRQSRQAFHLKTNFRITSNVNDIKQSESSGEVWAFDMSMPNIVAITTPLKIFNSNCFATLTTVK